MWKSLGQSMSRMKSVSRGKHELDDSEIQQAYMLEDIFMSDINILFMSTIDHPFSCDKMETRGQWYSYPVHCI